jgi:hypothetical protein
MQAEILKFRMFPEFSGSPREYSKRLKISKDSRETGVILRMLSF